MATVTDRPEGTNSQVEAPPAPPPARRRRGVPPALPRLTAALAALFAIAAVVVAIVLTSGPAGPPSGAATLVPANALMYVHVSTDPSRAEVAQALARVRRVTAAPLILGAVTGRLDAILSGSSGGAVDFSTDVRPWLGREAALAVLDTPGSSAGTLIVLDVRSRARARAFLAAHGAVSDGTYRRVPLLHQPSGTTLAFVGHYLVLGQPASVMSAIDVAAGRRSLAGSATYASATSGEPADRVIDLYAPVAGVRRALLPSQGLLGALGVLLDQPALSAVAVTVSPSASGLSVRVHSVLDAKLARAFPVRQFTPSLASSLPAGSIMVLDAGNLRKAAPKLLAAAARVGVLGRTSTLLSKLGGALIAQGVRLDRLFSIFGNETAFAVVPGAGGAPAPVLVGRTSNRPAALGELASLEAPLTQAFTPPSNGAGLVPEVSDTDVAGTTVSQLTLAPGFQLDWAVTRGLVVLSTSAEAIGSVIAHRASLDQARSYQAATSGLPEPVSSLLFLDLGPLLRVGEQTGLIGSASLEALAPDLGQIRAIGLASTSGGSDTTTELELQIR